MAMPMASPRKVTTDTAIASTKGTSSECPNLDLVTIDGSYDGTLYALDARSGDACAGLVGLRRRR
jgi:hypothetical protein